jgi:Ca2+/Na+ antiporter
MDSNKEQQNNLNTENSNKLVELEEHETKGSLWQVIKLPWWEFVLVLLLLGATITMFVLKNRLPEASGILIGVLVTSALLGLWLAFRPSEWAVDGLDNIMRYAGLTAYVAGVISSLASNLPEAVAAGILLVKGSSTGNSELITTAFYTTLAAAGFNAILLGIVVLVGGKKKGYIEIRKETVMAEGVLLRWGFVATLLTFGIAVVEMLEQLFDNLGRPWYYRDEELVGELPRLAGIALVVSYIIYIIYLIIKSRESRAAEQHVEPRATRPTRGKLDEKMPDTLRTRDVEITNSAHRKILDTPEEINIIDPECPQTDETYRATGKSVENPYLVAPTLEHPHLKIGAASVLVLLGIAGIAGGGYLLSTAVENMLHTTHIEVGIAALIVGFSGAVPEHGIAVVAATKGKTDVALGNILGGILQMTLLVFGAFAAIVKAPIDGFMLFQIIALAGIIWFVKRSISDDRRLTSFEGIMIIIAQLFSFLLLLGELTGLKEFLF